MKHSFHIKNFWGTGGACLKNELVLGEPRHPYHFLYIEFVAGCLGSVGTSVKNPYLSKEKQTSWFWGNPDTPTSFYI